MEKRVMTFVVPPELDGIEVQKFLRRFCGVSARLLSQLKRTQEGMQANGVHIRSIDKLHAGDRMTLTLPESVSTAQPVDLPITVVYEDDDVLAVNKPPFMTVHPVHGHQNDTLANAVAAYSLKTGRHFTFRPVNRLDKDTSGLVLIAKNPYAAAILPKTIEKVYMALCEGNLEGSGTIDAPIKLMEGHTIQRKVAVDGKRAVTHYEVLKNAYNHTLLRIILETGRTHQIRTHFSSIGHPLAGDDMYGGSRQYFERQCLHCAEMRFLSPETHEIIHIKCSPEDWFEILERKMNQSPCV